MSSPPVGNRGWAEYQGKLIKITSNQEEGINMASMTRYGSRANAPCG